MPKHSVPVSPFHTIWRDIDGVWSCISDPFINICLADFLSNHGFDIPDCITYCLAVSSTHSLKFRQSGGLISVFIKPLSYVKNSSSGN